MQRETALKVFTEAIGGDKPMSALTRVDALALRRHWLDRVVAGEVEIDTGNKNIGRVAGMYKAINANGQLGLAEIFKDLRIEGGTDRQRVAYDPAFVRSQFLAEGMFDDINDEERRIIYLLIETGLRLSEACNLSAQTIKLDAKVPYVKVRPEGRQLKTQQSEREIPLVGVALPGDAGASGRVSVLPG